MSLQLDGTSGVLGNSGAFIAGTAVASTSGTSIDFTSIPSWVKRVTVNFSAVSLSGSANPKIQLGSGTVTTTGYVGGNYVFGVQSTALSTSGFDIGGGLASASNLFTGNFVFTLLTGNTWIGTASLSATGVGTYGCAMSGSVTISGALTIIRITSTNGTDTFDAGSINILYE